MINTELIHLYFATIREGTMGLMLYKEPNTLIWGKYEYGQIYRTPAALKSARSLTTCSGIGGGVGKWSPVAWNPFSSATQLTVRVTPSGER